LYLRDENNFSLALRFRSEFQLAPSPAVFMSFQMFFFGF